MPFPITEAPADVLADAVSRPQLPTGHPDLLAALDLVDALEQRLSATADLRRGLRTTVATARAALGADAAHLCVPACDGVTHEEECSGLSDSEAASLRVGTPAAVTDVPSTFASMHAAPLQPGPGGAPGTLTVLFRQPRPITSQDERVLAICARAVSQFVERIQLRQALSESERRFRTMTDHAPMMIWMTEADGACSYLSRSWHEYTGTTTLTDWLDCVHEDDRARVLTVQRMAQARCRPVRLEYRLRRHDGEYRWVLDAAAPRLGDDGTLLGFTGSVLDIDEHRRRERDARFAAQLQSALAQLDDADEIMQVAADRICRYFGIPTLVFADVDEGRDEATVIQLHGETRITATPRTLADVIDDSLLTPLRSGQAITVHDVATDPRTSTRLDEYRRRDIGAVLIVPFPSGGRWRFVLLAQDSVPRVWRDDDRELLLELTARVHMRLERARANLVMRRSREQYRVLFDSIDEGFCVVEMLFDARGDAYDYRYLETNPAFERHSGLRNVLGRTMRELVPQHEEHWFRTFGEVAHSGRPVRFEAQARALQRWFDVNAFRIGPAEDRRVAVLFSDITGRKQTDEALRRNEERLRLALVTGRLGSWQLDLLTMELTCTALCKAHYGLAADAPLSYARLWDELLHPEDRDAMQHELRTAIEHHRDYDAEYRVVWPDGSVHWIVARGRAGYDSSGRAVTVAGVTLDITERRQTESALRDADRRKDEFIATLAHELRNPLAPLRHCLHILQMDALDSADTPRLHAMMDRQVRHLVRLVDDLLEVSRISRGKIELRTGNVDLAKVIYHAVDTSRPLIDAGRHELELDIAPQRLLLDADSIRLAQVFSNLLNNAAKYTPHGGRITVIATAEGEEAVVRVRDTGVGIPVDMLPRVFDMFSQVGHSLSQAQGGLGIGLTLVRSLVELHGGTVFAHSAGPGLGSEFIVRLPLLAQAQVAEPAAPSYAPIADAASSRLLVIDDNRESADSLAMFLRLCGKEVHVAYDGTAGIEAAARLRPDALLVDIGMPGRNGYDVCAHVRGQPWGESIAIFAVTGWGQKSDRERSEHTGFDGHLVKPVDPDALLALVDDTCRARRADTAVITRRSTRRAGLRPGRKLLGAARLEFALPCIVWLAGCATAPPPVPASATFVIVRHAEKATDNPRDPTLTPAGQARAERLASMLADAPLTAVYATGFRRTRSTAEPTAHRHGLAVTPYDAAQAPADTAAQLRTRHPHGTVLVVGHSNTAPALAAALCRCEVEPMPESEYGRYYRLTVPASDTAPARLEVLAW